RDDLVTGVQTCALPIFPEGLTSEQIVARLSDNDIFTGSVAEMPREGTLLPETYKFPRGTSREQVVQRMQQAQKRILAEIWEHRRSEERRVGQECGESGE